MALTIPEINFKLSVPKISTFKSIYTPEVMVYNIPWKVQIAKFRIDDVEWLGAYLYCAKENMTLDSSYAATLLLKLMPFDEHMNAVERRIAPHVFKTTSPWWGTSTWIRWNDLLDTNKKYVKNDAIKLDITIEMSDPNDENKSDVIFENVHKSCEKGCSAIHRMAITNVENLLAVQSPDLMLTDEPIQLEIYKHSAQLFISLQSDGDKTIKKRVTISLISSKSTKSIQQVRTCENLYESKVITSWNNLMKPENGFIESNSITLQIDIMDEEISSKMARNEGKFLSCAICLEKFDKQPISSVQCGHMFCTDCIENSLGNRSVCPICNNPADLNDLRRHYLPL